MKKDTTTLFSKTVRKLARAVPAGRVTTYGLLARAAGGGGQAARSITAILSRDPNHNDIPFHRIVYAGGRVWTSQRCKSSRMKLYKQEGIEVNKKGRIINFNDIVMYNN